MEEVEVEKERASSTIRALCIFYSNSPSSFLPLPAPLRPFSPSLLAPDGPPAVEDPRHAVGDGVLLGDAEDAAGRHRCGVERIEKEEGKLDAFLSLFEFSLWASFEGLSAFWSVQARAEALRKRIDAETRRERERERERRKKEQRRESGEEKTLPLHLLLTLSSFALFSSVSPLLSVPLSHQKGGRAHGYSSS